MMRAVRQAGIRRGRGVSGAVMIEFVLVIPLIALVIAATFFFGWGCRNRMGMERSDRFIAWVGARHAPFPTRYGPTWHDVVMNGLLQSRTMKDIYYHQFDRRENTFQTLVDLSDYVGDYSALAAPVTRRLLQQRWPRGYGMRIDAYFPVPFKPWAKQAGYQNSSHIRDGVEWRRNEASNEKDLTDEFQKDLDDALRSTPIVARGLAEGFRSLYLDPW